ESITDGAISCNLFFGHISVDELLQSLRAAHSDHERIKLVSVFLITHSQNHRQHNNCIYDTLVDQMIEINGLITVEKCLHGKITIRNLERYFKKHIGISPKLFLELLRHKFLLHQLYINPAFNWKDPLLDGHFYDQSHFNRDFQKFSLEKPIEYLKINHELAKLLV
ncbi:MAG: helix-turn-helix domain-containing protein, partial [Ignavibacteria bacterium]|nr:helix-turn-helix domain-containing protein [Ignavibacteria bacterium]